MRDIQVSPIPYIWRHCELRNGMFGMGFMGSGGSLGESGYLITIPGAVGEPGDFNVTIGTSGTIATASTDLPDLGSGFTWGIAIGGDARISVNSTASGQPNSMAILSNAPILTGDTAEFTVTVTNGVLMLGFPFIATGTVAGLMLDRLTATSTVALSLRKVRAAWAGSCVRIRRSSDSVETDIGFSATPDANGDYWLDTAAIAAFAPGGCLFTTVYDQTGNGRHATQTSPGSQPTYQATGWAASKPTMSFDGVNDYLNVPDHRAAFTTEIGVVAVARGTAASRVLFDTQQATGDNSGANGFGFDASSKLYFIADPATGGRPQPTTTASFSSTNFSAIGSYDNTNGALLFANAETPSVAPGSGSLNFGTGTTYPWSIGCYRPSVGSLWAGPVDEIILFNTAIGSTDRATIRASHTLAFGVP